jgi:hypothetical protein
MVVMSESCWLWWCPMSKIGFREVEELVDLHRGIVNFGDESSSVGDGRKGDRFIFLL